MTDNIKIARALLSVTDKTNLLPLAETLVKHGCEIISTGGTGKALAEAGIPFTEISRVSGNPEAFGGRMKTISFNVESAILYDRERDAVEAAELGITPIDMVVCNLYPFEQYQKAGTGLEQLIEYIDIGGPTMIRAAAKNYKSVVVVTDVHDYDSLIAELDAGAGTISLQTRKQLMAKAFNRTADYDSAIAQAMDGFVGTQSLRLSFTGGKTLRYGENSHQQAMYYRASSADLPSLYDIQVLHGIEVSYNNILDLQAAVETVATLHRQGCAVIKHNNPCGMAESDDQRKSLELAWAADTVSAFGGIIAFNSVVTLETAKFFMYDAEDKSQRKFIEIIAAPAFDADALSYLQLQKNLRVVTYSKDMLRAPEEMRIANNALLRQSKDDTLYSKLELATDKEFDVELHKELIAFGLKAVRHIKSNAIALVRKTEEGANQLIGMGSGQPNRVNSVGLAIAKAKSNLGTDTLQGQGIMLISDAFFPFTDNIDLAHEAGISIIVQPGGSIRDKYVVEQCRSYGMHLIITGTRHFKH